MAQEQNYQVNYTISVDSTKGTQQVDAFAASVSKLTSARTNLDGAVGNIKKMMDDIDKAFRTKSGKKRDYSFKMDINTNKTEEKLLRVKNLLGDIKEMSKGINLVINSGQTINPKAVKANARKIIDKKAQKAQDLDNNKTAEASIQNFRNTQKDITHGIGKINAALISLERGRVVNVNTEVAKAHLNELLSLIGKIKTGAKGITLGNLGAVATEKGTGKGAPSASNAIRGRSIATIVQARTKKETERKQQKDAAAALRKQQEEIQRKAFADQQRQEKEAQKQQQRSATQAVRNTQRQLSATNSMNNGRQRAAINRLQYSKAPSMRNLPMAHMFSGYMAFSLIRSELQEAIEYSNIMESAHSILKIADSDLGTFETRFDQMARNVRKIGVETKFTAIEVAGAVKFLSMAGMNIDTINKAIRPITNLALIGDNDISQIADLTTNIMAGYDIKGDSMNSVADIIASTVSRSNVNVIEMAESYKMAAGYLKLAGVDFSESAAAIGILGNSGIKGTMAGTSLRAMTTRFAKPTKEANKTLNRLGIKFTENNDIYGKQVEQLRPLADIFQDLQRKGASMADMQSIFGKIGGNAAMMFVNNHEKLRELSSQNRMSFGISSELAEVKQNTTKGLWAQMTSQFSESFMQGFEILEPQIKATLTDFLKKFSAPEFAQGIASIGRVLLDVLTVLGSIANWVVSNFTWIEPILFTGVVATKLFKLAGALTNVGVALGFIGKQSIASSSLQAISGLIGGGSGMGGLGKIGKLSMDNKRSIVTALNAAGITGKGNLTRALASSGATGASSLLGRAGVTGLFASQVSTGNGLLGAGASIGALGAGAVAATAAVAALVGVMGYLAYKTWKVKDAKDAVLEEVSANEKYRYPSIEALHESLRKTYQQALDTKKAVDDVVSGKTLEEESGQKIGAFTGNWWISVLSQMGNTFNNRGGATTSASSYSFNDAYQDDTKAALHVIARKDGQNKVNAAWSDFGKMKDPIEVGAYIQNLQGKYGIDTTKLDKKLYNGNADGPVFYNKGMDTIKSVQATLTPTYAKHINGEVLDKIRIGAQGYQQAISSNANAMDAMRKGNFNFEELKAAGFIQDSNGRWVQKKLAKGATDKQREDLHASRMRAHDSLVTFAGALRNTYGGSTQAVENILQTAGFPRSLYSNEPDSNDKTPFNKNRITNSV